MQQASPPNSLLSTGRCANSVARVAVARVWRNLAGAGSGLRAGSFRVAGRPFPAASAIPSRRRRASRRLRTSWPASACASTSLTSKVQFQTWPASVTSVRRTTGLPSRSSAISATARASSSFSSVLDRVGVGVGGDGQRDGHRDAGDRQVEVGQDRLRQLLVGDDDDVVRGRAQPRRAPADGLDEALFLAVVELDVVARAHGPIGEQVQAREEVGERVLQRERDRQRADAQRGQQRRDRDAQRLQRHDRGQHGDRRSARCRARRPAPGCTTDCARRTR